MRVIIPAAGEGRRFRDAGYNVPKPYVEVARRPMVLRVIDMFQCLQLDAQVHSMNVVVHVDHADLAASMLPDYVSLSMVRRTPEGAALSVLAGALAAGVEEDEEVVVCNSDNLFHPDTVHEFLLYCQRVECMGCIMSVSVPADGPYIYSYVHSKRDNVVTEVTEKARPTGIATAGIYYFRRWKALRQAIACVVANDDRTKNEFYLAPAYNYLAGRTLHWLMPEKHFWPVGTPEQLHAHERRLRDMGDA